MGFSNQPTALAENIDFRAVTHSAMFAAGQPPAPMPTTIAGRSFSIGLETASRACRSALIVVNDSGKILSHNEAAGALLSSGCVLGRRGGCLFIDRSSIQRTFSAELKALAAAGPMADVLSVAIGIPDRTGAIRYALKTLSVSTRDDTTEILLAVVDFEDRSAPSRATFTSVFRFSPREAELAALFASGLDLERIAREMGVALNTVRIHLRSIFFKTNCSGQIALMRILSRLV